MCRPPNPSRNRAGGVSKSAAVVFLFLIPTAFAQDRGEADLAAQGYYLGASSQAFQNTSGLALRFRTFLTGLGILSGSVEGYGSQNRFETGENFLQLSGAPWMGRRWNLAAGDFQAPGSLLRLPAPNLFMPEIAARGVEVEATRDDARYSFFAGRQTLSAGPRVAYRIAGPQTVMGASAVRRFGRRLEIGARFLQLSASPAAIE